MATRIVPAAPTVLDDLARMVRHLLHSHRRHAAHWWTRRRRTASAVLARVKPAKQRLLFEDTAPITTEQTVIVPAFGLLCGEDVITVPFDATEVALLAGARRLDGAL